MGKPICDFCSDPKPVWSLRCNTFKIAVAQAMSLGDWLACEDCSDLIMAGKWRELATRGAEKTSNGRKLVGMIGKDRAVGQVMKMHEGFREHFTGDARRINENRTR